MATTLDVGKKSQKDMILEHLEQHGSITPLVAYQRYGCMRLGARIWELQRELRSRGVEIVANMVEANGKHYAEYSLLYHDGQQFRLPL